LPKKQQGTLGGSESLAEGVSADGSDLLIVLSTSATQMDRAM
jgi:uncharacterized membrane protein